jgi:Zn-dependent protease with chaperone function
MRRHRVKRKRISVGVALAGLILLPLAAWAQKPRFRPGFNLFSVKQDIQLGQEAAQEIEKEIQVLQDPEIVNYVSGLGKHLSQYTPEETSYPWTFKVVNSQEINAFALPGGFIYLNRGILEAADNEAQVAGVLAHEIGHVVMRHGTNRASQAMLAQMPLAILGGFLGQGGSLTGQLAQLGIGFGLNSILLRNSRTAESQSDQVGAYILYHSGYDPTAMTEFFEIIQKKHPQRGIEFFASHPNPENRIKRVDGFIPQLGPAKEGRRDSPAFQTIKKKTLALPPPPKGKPAAAGGAPAGPPAPSTRLVRYSDERFSLAFPDNWQTQSNAEGIVLAPSGGILRTPSGGAAQAYGAQVFRHATRASGLRAATNEILESLRKSNPNLRVVSQTNARVSGRAAIATVLENDSPLGGQKETDHLITVGARDGVLAVVFVAPQSAFESYRPTFSAMLRSLEIR